MSESNTATVYYPFIPDQQPEQSQPTKKCSVRGCNQLVSSESFNKMCETCRGRHRVYAMTKRARRKQEKAAVVQAMTLHTGAQFVETISADPDGNAITSDIWTEVRPPGNPASFNQQTSPLTQSTWTPSIDTQLYGGHNETLNDRLQSSTSSELAHALKLPSTEADRPPRSELHTQGQDEEEEREEEENEEVSTSLEEGTSTIIDLPDAMPAASRRYCSVKGCKELIPDTYQFKMCPSCRVRYRDYGSTKRAKWKAERQAFKVEIARLRTAEDERRKEQGLPPFAELPEELRAWEQSLLGSEVSPLKTGSGPANQSNASSSTSQHPPSNAVSADTSLVPARMCTVSHCHKVLPTDYQYKRCEQHRIQNRYHSRLKRVREKVFKSEGHASEPPDTGPSSEILEQPKDMEDLTAAHNATDKNTQGPSNLVISNVNPNSDTLEKRPETSFLQGRTTSAMPSAIQPFSDLQHEEDTDAEGETDSSPLPTIFETGDNTMIPSSSAPVPEPPPISMPSKPPDNTGEQQERLTSTANLITLDDPQVIAPYKSRRVPLRVPSQPRRTKIFQDIYTPNGRIKVDNNQASSGSTGTDATNTTPIYTPTIPSSSTLVYQPVTKWRTSNLTDKNSEGVDADVSKKNATFMGVLAPSYTTDSMSAVSLVSKENVQNRHEIVSAPSTLPISANHASQGTSPDATLYVSTAKMNPPPPQPPPPSPPPPLPPPQPQHQVSQPSYPYHYSMQPPYPLSYFVPPPLHPFGVPSYPPPGGSYPSSSSSALPSTSSAPGLYHSYSYYPPVGYPSIPPPGCTYVPRYLPPTYGHHVQPYGSHHPPFSSGYSHTVYPLVPTHVSCQQPCITGYGQRTSPEYKENFFSFYHHPDSQNTSALHEVPLQKKKRRKINTSHVLSSGQTPDLAQPPVIPSTSSHPPEWPDQMPSFPSAHPRTTVDSSNQSAHAGSTAAEQASTSFQDTNAMNPPGDSTTNLMDTLSGLPSKVGSQHERKCAKRSCQRIIANDAKSFLCAKCMLRLKKHQATMKQRYKLEPRKSLVIKHMKRQDDGRDFSLLMTQQP